MEAASLPRSDGQTSQPPPDEALLVAIVLVLLSGAPRPDMAAQVQSLLSAAGFAAEAVTLAVELGLGAAVAIGPPDGGSRGPALAQMARTVPARRAAFLLGSARRADQAFTDVPRMLGAADALAETGDRDAAGKLRDQARVRGAPELAERRYLAMHLAAERARAVAAVRADRVVGQTGSTTLGWRATLDDVTSAGCRALHRTNFDVLSPPEGSLPGTRHGGSCRCVAQAAWLVPRALPEGPLPA